MNKKDIAIGAVIVIVLIGAIIALRRAGQNNNSVASTPAPTASVEQKIEDAFKVDIPDDADKAELNGSDGSGIATREYKDQKFTATILADLPDKDASYRVEIRKADQAEDKIVLGVMRVAKGGYMIEYQSNKDLTSYEKVVVLTADSKVVLEGSFN